MAKCPGSAHQPLPLPGVCLYRGPTSLLGVKDQGRPATTVTEGTFPSHLELSKSRSQFAGLAVGPSLGLPPPGLWPHRHMEGVCTADAGLGGSQKPHRSEPITVSLLRELHRSPPALPTSAKGLYLPLGGSQLEFHCL